MDWLLELGRTLGFLTVRYLFPRRWRQLVDPRSDLAGWIGIVEIGLIIALILFLMVQLSSPIAGINER